MNMADVQAYFVSMGIGEETVALVVSFIAYSIKTFVTDYSDSEAR